MPEERRERASRHAVDSDKAASDVIFKNAEGATEIYNQQLAAISRVVTALFAAGLVIATVNGVVAALFLSRYPELAAGRAIWIILAVAILGSFGFKFVAFVARRWGG